MSYRCAAITADQSVRRAGWQAEDERDEVPGNCTEQSREENLLSDEFDVDHAFADGGGYRGAEDKGGDEVPEGGPGYGAEGREYAGGDDGGDGVGGIVPTVREFEGQRVSDDGEEEGEARHGCRPRLG